MKKFQFAAGLLAVGLLASCSSDAPEMPNNTPVDNGTKGEMFLSIRLDANNTRADETEEGTIEESKIEDIHLFLLSGDNLIFSAQANSYSDFVAKFKVSNVTYSDLVRRQAANEDFTVRVIANSYANTGANITTDFTASTEVVTWTDNKFIFSGLATGKLAAPVTGAGTEDKPWRINGVDGSAAVVALDRLASRFDITAGGEAKATTSDNTLQMTVVGMKVETWSNATNWFKQATTPALADGRKLEQMKDYTYVSGTTYARPIIAKSGDIKDVAFAAVQVKMTSTNTEMAKAMEADQTLYAYKGYLIGSVEMMNTEGFEFKAEGEKAEPTIVAEINKAINDLKAVNGGKVNELNLTVANGFFAYDSDKSEKHNYYTYYSSRIKTGTEKIGTVERNNIYRLSANSFFKLGTNGNYVPEEDPTPTTTDMWFDLQVSINPWLVNTNAWDF